MTDPKAADAWFWVPWLLTAGGIFGNFLWNWINSRTASRLRLVTVKLEEFRRLRQSIQNDLDALTNERSKLESLASSALSSSRITPQVKRLNISSDEAYQKLQLSLKRFDQSQFASGNDWEVSADTVWDEFVQTLDGAYNTSRNATDRLEFVRRAAVKLGELIAAMERRLEDQIREVAAAR